MELGPNLFETWLGQGFLAVCNSRRASRDGRFSDGADERMVTYANMGYSMMGKFTGIVS